ncbi:amidohydrolase family protein [Rubrivirga sp.]|uniref:amidohydrolase family protein n=1 Tax=Rubrivirga sp. TaxID=1885344 RepID=UPI003B522EB4
MSVRVCLAALAVLLLVGPARAQGVGAGTPLRPVTGAAAITNARVVVAPGRVLERATVVVRDGRIVAVGRDVAVPFDADVVEGDSLTVYAGFVDAFGIAGVPKPEDPDDYDGDRGAPPRALAGLTPERDVRDGFDPSDARIKQLREVGFTAAHVAPRGGFFAGQGAVVLLRETGRQEAPEALVLTEPVSVVAAIDPASGVYPATPMGVLAEIRETVENARRRQAGRTAYDRAAEGASRPRFDPVLDAVGTLLDGDRQLVFVAESWLDGFRALRVSQELGLRPVLAGVPDAAPLLGRLRADEVAVFAPLALPDTVKADSTALAVPLPSTTPGEVSFVTNRRIVSYRDAPTELEALTVQKRAAVARAEASPAALDSAGVTFAFATFEVKPAEVHANLRRMVRAGLAPDAALAALTTTPAELLGLGREIGTVEVGKLANLVVTTGPLFQDSTEVRHVFVEGVGYEVEAGGPEGADPDAVVQAVGTWDFEVSTPGGAQTGTFTITGSGGDLSGTFTSGGETSPATVSVAGNALTMSFSTDDFGTVTITGIITGDEFSGTAAVGPLGSFPMTATRQPE